MSTIKHSKLGGIHELIDEDYLNHIREMQCCVQGCNNYASPHHIQSRKRGRNDSKVIPLCAKHHVTGGIKEAIHQAGKYTWQKIYNIDIEELADRLWGEYSKNKL